MKKNIALHWWVCIAVLVAHNVSAAEKDLGTIVVTPTRSALASHEVPSNITIITREEIVKSGAYDAGELLADYTSIIIGNYGGLGAQSSISLRGSTAQQTLIMVDGMPINDTGLGSAKLHQLLLSNIERVEIVRGGSSALYGANAVSGVINFITRKASTAKPFTEIGITYGSFQKKYYHLGYGIKKGRADVYITGDRVSSDGFRINENTSTDQVFIRVGFDFREFGSLTLKGNIFRNKAGIPGPNFTPVDQWDGSIERLAFTPDERLETDNRYGMIDYEYLVSDTLRLRTRVYGNIDRKKSLNSSWPPDKLFENKTLGTEFQADIPFHITIGGDYRNDWYLEKARYSDQLFGDEKFINRAVYIQHILSGDRLILVPGLRLDNHSVYDTELNPRIMMVYKVNKKINVSANASRSFRAPAFTDIIYNRNIQPEIGRSYDVGFKTVQTPVGCNMTFFLTDTTDLIVWKPDILTLLWKPVNISGITRSQGVEFETSQKIGGWMKHTLSYTYVSVKKRETNKPIFYKPSRKVHYRIALCNQKGSEISLTVKGVSRQFITQSATSSLPGYGLLDVRLSQQMHSMNIALGINNMLDKQYMTRDNYPLAGRTIYATVSVSFLD